MKKSVLLIAIVAQTVFTYAQEIENQISIPVHTYYVEILGTAGFYSFNYDRVFYKKNSLAIAGRIGFTYWPRIEGTSDVQGPGIPIEITGLLGKNRGVFEFGMGMTYFYFFPDDESGSAFFFVPRLGYRNQKMEGGFFYRIGFTPWIPYIAGLSKEDREMNSDIIPMIGLSIGYTIKN